jgi:hypothetical protein
VGVPDWLERLISRNPGVEFLPLVLCIGLAVAVWWWQWTKTKRRNAASDATNAGTGALALHVGWGPGVALVALVVVGVAAFAVTTDLGAEVWGIVRETPWLAAWWVFGVGVAVMVWGFAVHAWRGEGRLARQCRRCRYDMTGVPGLMKCPECGRVAKTERQLRPVNVRRWAMWVGAALVALGLLLPSAITVLKRGWPAALPSWAIMRWTVAAGGAPDGVLLEFNHRVREDPGGWRDRLMDNRDALAERMLESPRSTRHLYETLLQWAGGSVSTRVLSQANAAVASSDAERRRAGLALLLIFQREPVPFSVLRPLLTDADPATAQTALSMVIANRDSYLVEVAPHGKTRDVESVRVLMRTLTSTNMYLGPPLDNFTALRDDPDPEIAARATLLAFYVQQQYRHRPGEMLRRAVLAVATLDAVSPNTRSAWLEPVHYYGFPAVRAAMLAMINDPDPAARRALFTQMEGFSALNPGGFPGTMDGATKVTRIMEDFLPALRERLKSEEDPGAKQLLQKLIDSIEGKPAAGQMP